MLRVLFICVATFATLDCSKVGITEGSVDPSDNPNVIVLHSKNLVNIKILLFCNKCQLSLTSDA